MTDHVMSPLSRDVQRRIKDALTSGAERDAHQISVEIDDDCAVLTGSVRSWTEHEDAEAAALSTPGIRSVDNRLALKIKARVVTD